jgi:hypothetical protein
MIRDGYSAYVQCAKKLHTSKGGSDMQHIYSEILERYMTETHDILILYFIVEGCVFIKEIYVEEV